MAHLVTYLRLLDADAEGADWREVATMAIHGCLVGLLLEHKAEVRVADLSDEQVVEQGWQSSAR